MRHVRAPRADSYPILLAEGGLDRWPELLSTEAGPVRFWVVTDTTVRDALGDRLLDAPGARDVVCGTLALPAGEKSKSVDTWLRILDWLGAHGARRRDIVLAFGGSVVSDVAGFAAAAFMRGIRYVNVPTSLLAQVDGSIGGKVAVNTPWAKNVLGAFHHPSAVLIDPSALTTLPRVELSNGLAEVIKCFVITPGADFDACVDRIPACLDGDLDALQWTIRAATNQKMDLVDPDPYEVDLDRVLNFGHTLGHAIEASTGYGHIRHGMAVAIGMACAVRIAVGRGLLDDDTARRIFDALHRAELPDRLTEGAEGVIEKLAAIAMIRDGRLRFVLSCGLGRTVFRDDITRAEVLAAAVG
jgi:3-dehydroquinate synthase